MYFASESQHAQYYANHRDRAEAAQRRISRARAHRPVATGLVRVERTARAVKTTPAAERATNLKGPGLSTARRDATHCHYSAVPGSPPAEDEWKLVGDLPELCLGPNSHGFADLDAAVTLSCSLATYYPKGHAMRA